MKFLMEFNDTLLHKLSPLAWVLLPTVGLIAGIYGGLVTAQETLKFPLLSLALLTVISVIDAYCAIFVISGFLIAQITLGEVMNFRTVIEIATLGLTLVGTGLISSHLQLVFQKETGHKSGSLMALLKSIFRAALSSLITAAFFLLAFLLAQSLSNDSVMARGDVIIVALLAGLVSALKYYLHQAQDIKIFRSARMESLKDVHQSVEQIISPFWNSLIILSSFFGVFVWTENWAIALIFGLLNVIYFGLLLMQLPTHNFRYVLTWERSIVIEPIVFTLVSIALYVYIDKLPLQASDRSIIFIIGVYVISIIHNVMSQLAEITQSPLVSQK